MMKTLGRFGIDPDLKAIEARANRAFNKIERVIAEGIEPDEAMWKQIEEGHAREMAQSLRRMTKQAIRLYRLKKMEGSASKFMWTTVSDQKVCPSCYPRHGKIKTMTEWRRIGLPGSGALVCSEECRCNLVPAS